MRTKLKVRSACILGAAILVGSGCGTTTQRVGASEAALKNFGISPGDVVLVRYANEGDPRSSSSSQWVELTAVNGTGITAVTERGETIHTPFEKIFEIERTQGRRKELREMPALESTIKASGRLLLLFVSYVGATHTVP